MEDNDESARNIADPGFPTLYPIVRSPTLGKLPSHDVPGWLPHAPSRELDIWRFAMPTPQPAEMEFAQSVLTVCRWSAILHPLWIVVSPTRPVELQLMVRAARLMVTTSSGVLVVPPSC